MNKAYSRINFQNAPSTATPLNATNLNKMDKAINDLDDRIIELSGYQEEAEESAEMASASASAAAKAAETATADAEARVNEVIQGLEVYTKADSHKKFASVIKQVATGSPILITDSSDATAIDFKGKGRSTQKIKMIQGYYDSLAGTYATNANAVCNEKPIPCKTGDNIAITIDTASTIIALFYNGNTFVSASKFENATQATFAIPSNANYYNFDIIKNSNVTPSTVGAISIKVNGSVGYPNPNYSQAIKSVGDGGWFDGELLQGVYSFASGVFSASSANYVCSKNPIPCNPNDKIVLKYDESVYYIGLVYYDENLAYVGNVLHNNKSEINVTVPSNAKFFRFNLGNQEARFDLANAKHITVTINGKYALIVKSKWKNLLNINESDKATTYFNYTEYTNEKVKGTAIPTTNGAFLCSYFAYLENGKTYFFSQESTNLNSVYIYSDRLWGTNIGNVNVVTAPYYTHKAESGIYIIGYYGAITSGTEYSIVKPMLRRAEVTDGTYEPYKEEVKYIPLNEPLRSSLDGSVSDVVDLGERKVTRKYAKVVYNASSFMEANSYANVKYFSLPKPTNSKAYGKNADYPTISDKFTFYVAGTLGHDNTKAVGAVNSMAQSPRYWFGFPVGTTLEEAQSIGDITLIYELAEPIVEEIEPVDIVTYDNVTYLTASDNAEMEVTYATDTKSYIDSKFAELQAALVNML